MTYVPDATQSLSERMLLSKEWLKAKQIPEKFAIVEKVLAKIDLTTLDAMVEKYEPLRLGTDPFNGPYKFLDIPFWIARAVWRMHVLELEKRAKCNVLDLGCGGSHFLAGCRALGFRGTGIDVPNPVSFEGKPIPLYDDLASLFGVERFEHRILPNQPMRKMRRKFGVVTAFLANFNEYTVFDPEGTDKPRIRRSFDNSHWLYFFNDLVDNHLKFPAVIHLELNAHVKTPDGTYIHDENLIQWFKSIGGTPGRGGLPGAMTFALPKKRRFK